MQTTLAPATRETTPLTLDDRLTLAHHAIDDRLARTAADMLIRTAGIPIPDVEIGPPILAADDRPLAQLLERAARRLAAGRWSRDSAVDSSGGICPLWAIRAEAGSEREEGEARTLLLQAIRGEQPDVVSVPYWNSRQASGAAAVRMLQAAARLA